MKTILTKIHFFGAIDVFAIPLFFLGTIFLIFSIKRADMSFLSNLILSGKIFLLIIFIGLGSVLSSHCICKIYFNDDKKNNSS
jgi:multisubunit Na+/H+ antiporter MnhG subunit